MKTRLDALLALRGLIEQFGVRFRELPKEKYVYLGNLLLDSGLALRDCSAENLDREIALLQTEGKPPSGHA